MTAFFLVWAPLDMALRGAAASLLLFHLANIMVSRLPLQHRWRLVGFVTSVLAYLLCSWPDFASFNALLRLPLLALCLMSAPLLWLALRAVFEDDLRASPWAVAAVAALVALAIVLGGMAMSGVGGLISGIGHKMVLIGFAAASVWAVLKDWRSDLVPQRRLLRSWVTASLGAYVLLVLCVELVYMPSRAPAWLELVNLGGIVGLTGVLAVICARHPLELWMGPPVAKLVELPARHADSALPASAELPLTPAPVALDRKAAISARLNKAMVGKRAYAQEGLSLAQLAEQIDATPVQLREVINQALGYRNFNDFLHHYRIDEAAQRLLVQDLPILSIALDVGYGSIGPFNRAFKQIKRVTPSEFRTKKP